MDGRITSPNEWAESLVYGISLDRVWGWPDRQVEPNSKTINVRFKNDEVWLYMLYQIPWSANETDLNDGAFIECFSGVSDYGQLAFSNTTYDAYGWNGSRWLLDTQAGGQDNVEGAASYDGTYYWFEFRKMLDSGDGVDWSLTPGEYVDNLMVGIWDNSFSQTYEQSVSLQLALPPSTLVSCSPNPVSIGSPVTCTTTVSGSNPTGIVTWSTSSSTGNFSQSMCTLSNGTCSTTYVDTSPGSVTITACYSGDSNNAPSSGSTTLTVTSSGSVYYSSNYTSVQAAINAAPPGATVIIALGFYSESLIVDKPLTIIGERDVPVFSGGASSIYLTLLSGASGSNITGIEITNWPEGILVENASNCTIYRNIMAYINSSGIVLEGNNATNNVIYSNIFQNVPTPINLTASAGNNTVYGNIISSQTTATLNVEADGNSIYGNIISGSEILVNMTNSNGNVIYHNNFLTTTQITVIATGNNTWDSGSPSGGNYWSIAPNIIGSNNTDHNPLMKPWPLATGHCIAVISFVAAKIVVGQGFSDNMTVCVADNGEYAESFSVTAYANATGIGIRQVGGLNASCQMVLTFKWNTSSLAYGNYTISAYAQPVANQTDVSGNDFTLGTLKVTIPGDLNGDFKVDLKDLVSLANAYGSKPNNANWNSNADIDGNGAVGLSDLVILAQHYGQHYP